MIKEYTLKALEKAIQHTLTLDPESADKMAALEGKVIEMVISPLSVVFYIQFSNKSLNLLHAYEGDVDTRISSSPIGLIRLSLLPASKVRSLFNDEVKISGDIDLGQKVKALFDELDIDWEGYLAQFTGDVVAHQLGLLVKRGRAIKDKVTSSTRESLKEYVQEELRAFPSAEEMDDWFKDVDALALQVERIEATIKQRVKS